MNKIKVLILFIQTILIFSCQKGYEQKYNTFNEFSEENERNKGWFPKIIDTDATKLRNISYLDPLCAFGKFTYTNSETYDSIFSINQKISFDLLNDKVERNLNLRPDWFLDLRKINKSNVEIIKKEGFYILRDKVDKNVYFILSN
ncbi:hypothetical protein [Chryseobacterium oryctis]|uniref:YbbD head domain-containing protein n=1 Tax=Chryseobacterium oryctis TaxID=2952618 RepID=A0ABT3HQG4_9FLAO|nr:hypothetical protein [Chryseobacterium oryctis]MCW3162022.1 hypothetical protein [Chryseobacterium oryctis]